MQNDPIKTICTTMFIVAVIQHIKIGDLSMRQSSFSLCDTPAEDMMDTSDDYEQLQHGAEVGHFPIFSKDQERTLTRDSTAGFAGEVFLLLLYLTPRPDPIRQRLGDLSLQTSSCFVREPSRRRGQEGDNGWKAGRVCPQIHQEHD